MRLKLEKKYFIALIFLIFWSLDTSISLSAPVPREIKSVVVYILIEKDGKLLPNGTGFFVGVKDPLKTNVYAVYLVTARHVIFKPKTKEYYSEVFIRINTKNGGSEISKVVLVPSGKKRNIFTHSDESVDIVGIPMFPDEEKYEYKFLTEQFLTTKEDYEKLEIREGSDVFFTGLFSGYPGVQKNHPVVRFGRVALVTEEKINWDGQLMDLYLIEAASYGGNSGSPVFFYLGTDRVPGSIVVGPPVIKLAGIVQGTFLDSQEIRVTETAKIPLSVSNIGISAVVPSYKLKELLDNKELKKLRGF